MKKIFYEVKGSLCLTECNIREHVRVHSSFCCFDCTNFSIEGKDEHGTFVMCRDQEIIKLSIKK